MAEDIEGDMEVVVITRTEETEEEVAEEAEVVIEDEEVIEVEEEIEVDEEVGEGVEEEAVMISQTSHRDLQPCQVMMLP